MGHLLVSVYNKTGRAPDQLQRGFLPSTKMPVVMVHGAACNAGKLLTPRLAILRKIDKENNRVSHSSEIVLRILTG